MHNTDDVTDSITESYICKGFQEKIASLLQCCRNTLDACNDSHTIKKSAG